jgi:hypothetical protein
MSLSTLLAILTLGRTRTIAAHTKQSGTSSR